MDAGWNAEVGSGLGLGLGSCWGFACLEPNPHPFRVGDSRVSLDARVNKLEQDSGGGGRPHGDRMRNKSDTQGLQALAVSS